MRRVKFMIAVILSTVLLVSCNQNSTKSKCAQKSCAESVVVMDSTQVDSLVTLANQKREGIERSIGKAIEVLTTDLRGEIKQRWQKIHFYIQNGEVVRVKVYPYEKISTRTNEFYLENEELIIAVVKDKVSTRGSEESRDRQYYFNHDILIKKIFAPSKVDKAIKDSDAYSLLSDLKEYMEVYKSIKK